MRKNYGKEFSRNICFTFFEDFRKTAKEIETDFGKESVADYYNAIIDYALYANEPELKGVIKYIWHTTKASIDKSIERRSNGFTKEDTEKTEKVLNYKKENPTATQREIADATGVSVGKVNKVLNKDAFDSISITDSNTSSISTTSIEREHEHDSHEDTTVKKESEKKKDRKLEELSDTEQNEIIRHFRNGTMKYGEMYKQYHLIYGCLTKESILKLEEEMRIKANKNKEEIKNSINLNALKTFGLTQNEGDELCDYLSGYSWSDFSDTIENYIGGYLDTLNMSAYELLIYLRNNELARNDVYKRNHYSYSDDRFIINQDYRWDYYEDYLNDYIANPITIAKKVTEYENNKRTSYLYK